ncbi:MAG TPA: fumarylacetoacetate hydrolase family protein [Oligoflexus sp.]|uniref:fumarylacetoacetate hydrolase family protein n=1 Tax=Oligoflexus sp. TaxID=1971216 RepID=UPI002D5B6A68|nr:fumarylacetoacetate hydrolase family protein [Oligoflexus sp.]HYX36554.1 fumarylacetoacetate hydrolase family protein [Oligoflexus sp.]
MSHPYQVEPAQPEWPRLSGNIYCIGRNYADHAKELGNEVPAEPVVFLKAPSALRRLAEGPLAFPDETFHHELELVLLVGRHMKVQSDVGPDSMAAVTLGLDLTRRAVQDQLKKKSLPWTIAKSFSGAAVLAPFVSAQDLDLTKIDLQLEVNGEVKQVGHTRDMLFPCYTILHYLLSLQNLFPGDLIFTGTPSGVGPVRRGDQLRVFSEALQMNAEGRL